MTFLLAFFYDKVNCLLNKKQAINTVVKNIGRLVSQKNVEGTVSPPMQQRHFLEIEGL